MNILNKLFIVLFLLIYVVLFSETVNSSSSVKLDNIEFNWVSIENNIEFTIKAKTLGWVAIGFEPSKVMKDADIIIGYVEDGELFIEDHYGKWYTSHSTDISLGGESNVEGIKGVEVDGYTTMMFKIPLKSGDKFDKDLELGKEYKIILAYGKRDNFKSMHSFRTSILVKL